MLLLDEYDPLSNFMRSILASGFVSLVLIAACTESDAGPSTTLANSSTTTSAVATEVAPPTTESSPAQSESRPVVEVVFPEGTGGLAGGGTRTTLRLQQGTEYRFSLLLPVLSVTPPAEHWEVRAYDDDAARLRWRGESGLYPGTIVVTVFAGRAGTIADGWAAVESELRSGLSNLGLTLTWLDTGSGDVGEVEGVEWREIRTGTEKPIERASSPCVVVIFDEECVWFESTARLYVVPVSDLVVPILVTEQMCDCDLGGLGRLRKDNELLDHLEVVEEFLGSVEFHD